MLNWLQFGYYFLYKLVACITLSPDGNFCVELVGVLLKIVTLFDNIQLEIGCNVCQSVASGTM